MVLFYNAHRQLRQRFPVPLIVEVFSAKPLAVYLGWVTVATVANISALRVQAGFSGGIWLSAEIWAVVLLVVAVLIGSIPALGSDAGVGDSLT